VLQCTHVRCVFRVALGDKANRQDNIGVEAVS
jgi:hypothetical protein